MSSCNKCRKMMAGALYGDLSARRQKLLDTHLASCPACAKEYRQLTLTLKVMDQREIPEVPPTYWPSFWARLSDKIEQAGKRAQQPAWWRWLPSELPIRPALVPIAAALLLVATGIYIGRSIYLDHSPTGLPVASKAAVLDPVAIAEYNNLARSYLERANVVLLGLDNFDTEYDDPAAIDFYQLQTVSQELLYQGRELRNHQATASNPNLQSLIDLNELILLTLANSDENQNPRWTIRLVQEGIDNNSILMRISMTEAETDVEERSEPLTPPAVESSVLFI